MYQNQVRHKFSHVEKTTSSDVLYMSSHLRKSDVNEVKAATGLPIIIALFRSWFSSYKCETIFNPQGIPVGLYGAVLDTQGNSIVWMVATDGLLEIARDFIKHCEPIVDNFNHISPVLYNVVDARNKVHIRWLKHLGFVMINKYKYWGVEKRLFYKFVRIMPNV